MKIEAGNRCPFIGGDCIGLQCRMMVQIRGVNPNTGEPVDEWDCTLRWVPVLLIENSQQQRQTGAAVESFRNEMVKSNEASRDLLVASVNPQLIGGSR
jgi:hypothetical protein